MDDLSSRKAMVEQHVAHGRKMRDEQATVVAGLKERGLDAADAEEVLNLFEIVLELLKEDLARLHR